MPHDWSDMPLWAYGVTAMPHAGDKTKPPDPPGRKFDPAIDHVEQLRSLHEGSRRTYWLVDLSDWQNVVDWFPNEHVPMPSVVQHGPASLGTQTRACAFCHKTTGGGRPDNAPVAGLPAPYFLRQLEDFRAGRRKSSDPCKSNIATMIALAQAMSEDEEGAAAEYYAAQRGGPPVPLIETNGVHRQHTLPAIGTSRPAANVLSRWSIASSKWRKIRNSRRDSTIHISATLPTCRAAAWRAAGSSQRPAAGRMLMLPARRQRRRSPAIAATVRTYPVAWETGKIEDPRKMHTKVGRS